MLFGQQPQLRQVEEVPDDEDQRAAAYPLEQRLGHRIVVGLFAQRLEGVDLLRQLGHGVAVLRRASLFVQAVREEQVAQRVAVVLDRVAHCRGDLRHHFLLEAVLPEMHAPAQHHRHDDAEFALFAEDLDVGRAHLRRDVPVDVADVVAGHVLAQLDEVVPFALEDGGVVADQLAEHLAAGLDEDTLNRSHKAPTAAEPLRSPCR